MVVVSIFRWLLNLCGKEKNENIQIWSRYSLFKNTGCRLPASSSAALRKPAFVLRQRFLCLRRWMRSWHPCYSRTVSTEQTATTWGLLVVQTSSGMMFLEYAWMYPCMPMLHGFILSYPSIYHTALGPAHRYTRLRGRLAVLIWNPRGQWFEGFELTLDSPGNPLQRISPASNDIHPCSCHEPS